MSSNDITKKAFSTAIKELLAQKPLSAISVKDISERCNISRNTFYYHFKDKYELINWIFYTEILAEVNTFDDPSKFLDSFMNLCGYLHQNRKFYLCCFQYIGQNCLKDYLQDFYYELFRMNINVQYTEIGIRLPTKDLDLMAHMKAYSYIGILFDWVKNGMNDDYINYYELLSDIQKFEETYYKVAREPKGFP